MATQIAISTDEIVIRYRQPYVSEALNRKAVSEFGGIQKGFRFTTVGAAVNQIILAVDEQAGVSAMNLKNEANPEFSVAWVRDSDLAVAAPQAAGWHHLFVDHGYVFGQETTPSMTWYSSAEVADPATATPGMYIGSVEGVAAGQNVVNHASTYAISDGTILKRSTASTDSGARTRVRGDNEEPVFFTDFNSRAISPVDLSSGLTQTLTARVVTSAQLANDTMYGGVNTLNGYTPETSDHALLVWRRDSDTNNRGDAQGQSPTLEYSKTYSIPAHIPISNDSLSNKVRLFVRYKATRNNGLRFADTLTDWVLRLNMISARNDDGDLSVQEVVGRDVAILLSNGEIISSATLTLGHTNNNYVWASVEVEVPTTDANGSPISIDSAALNLTVPDMLAGEVIAIDRILVESDVRPAIDAVDGAQSLGPVLGRFSAAGLDSLTGESVIHPYSRGLVISRGGDIPYGQDNNRTLYGLELADHNVMIGLPARLNDGSLVGINREGDDFSLVMSDNLGSSFRPLENLFRQSNLVINAPGQYDTTALIASLEANGSTVPEALRAPQRAGLTVNNGNVVINSAKGSIKPDLSTLGNSPLHETGQLIADGVILNGPVRFGALEDGQFLAGWSGRRLYVAPLGDYSSDTDISQSLYFEPLGGLEDTHHVMRYASAKSVAQLMLGMNAENQSLVSDFSTINNFRFDERLTKNLTLAVVDSGQRDERHNELPDGSMVDSGFLDVPVAGLRDLQRHAPIGSAGIDSLSISNHVTHSTFLDATRSSYGVDFPEDLYGETHLLTIDSTAPNTWSGSGLIKMGATFKAKSYWENGLLVPANNWFIKGQFVPYTDLEASSVFKVALDQYGSLGPRGVGLEISHGVIVRPFSDVEGDRQIDFGNSSITLDLGSLAVQGTATTERPDDLDEPYNCYLNFAHYLTPLSATGDALPLNTVPDSSHKFRFQVLGDSDTENNYPDYDGQLEAAHYIAPTWRFSHTVRDALGTALITGEARFNPYNAFLQQAGFIAPNGAPNYTGFNTVGEFMSGVLVSIRNFSLSLDAFNYPLANALTRVGDWDDAQAYLRSETGDTSRDFSVSDGVYTHEFGVSICYDASFGTTDLIRHPIALTPKIAVTGIYYRVRSL